MNNEWCPNIETSWSFFSVGCMGKIEKDKVFSLPRDINTPGKKIQLYTSNQITELPSTFLQ